MLFSVDVASGRQKDLQDLGTGFTINEPWMWGSRLSLAPDGKSFAITIRKLRSDLWMLEGFDSHRGWLWKW